MVCIKCKKEIPEELTFCPFCGAKQKEETIEETTEDDKSEKSELLEKNIKLQMDKENLEKEFERQRVELERKQQEVQEQKEQLDEKKKAVDEDYYKIDHLLNELRQISGAKQRKVHFSQFDQSVLTTIEGKQRLQKIEFELSKKRPVILLVRRIDGIAAIISWIVSIVLVAVDGNDVVLGLLIMLAVLLSVLYIPFLIWGIIAKAAKKINPKLKNL